MESSALRSRHHGFSLNTLGFSPSFMASDSACCWSWRSWRCSYTLPDMALHITGVCACWGHPREGEMDGCHVEGLFWIRLHADHTENHCAIEAKAKVPRDTVMVRKVASHSSLFLIRWGQLGLGGALYNKGCTNNVTYDLYLLLRTVGRSKWDDFNLHEYYFTLSGWLKHVKLEEGGFAQNLVNQLDCHYNHCLLNSGGIFFPCFFVFLFWGIFFKCFYLPPYLTF